MTKILKIISLLFLISCQAKNDSRINPQLPQSQLNYSLLTRKQINPRSNKLPSIMTEVYFLRFKDTSVKNILNEISDMVDLPIVIDDSINKKSKDTRMTLVANHISLHYVLNWCARALECNITWLEGESIVYFGNNTPPFSNVKKLKSWPVHNYLTEFQSRSKNTIMNYKSDPGKLSANEKVMNEKLAIELEKLAKLEEAEKPLLEFILRDESEWKIELLETEKPKGDRETFYHNDPLLKEIFAKMSAKQVHSAKYRFNKVIDSLSSSENDPFYDNSLLENIKKYSVSSAKFLDSLIEKLVKENKSGFDNFKLFNVEIRLQFYKTIISEMYRYNRQLRFSDAHTPINEFVTQNEIDLKFVVEKTKKAINDNTKETVDFVKKSEEETAKILKICRDLLGKHSDSNNFKVKNKYIIAQVNNWEKFIIDSFLFALDHPQKVNVTDGNYQKNIIKKSKTISKFNNMVNCNVTQTTLDDLLYQWSSSSGISLAYTVDNLPLMGQVPITLNKGLQTIENSLKLLNQYLFDRDVSRITVHVEDINVLWVGNNTKWMYTNPLPYPIKTINLPDQLDKKYDAYYVTGYLKTLFGNFTGSITATADNNGLVICVPPNIENNINIVITKAVKNGNFDKRIK